MIMSSCISYVSNSLPKSSSESWITKHKTQNKITKYKPRTMNIEHQTSNIAYRILVLRKAALFAACDECTINTCGFSSSESLQDTGSVCYLLLLRVQVVRCNRKVIFIKHWILLVVRCLALIYKGCVLHVLHNVLHCVGIPKELAEPTSIFTDYL
jgi:hypothetical protein